MSIFDFALKKEKAILEKTYDSKMDVIRDNKKEKVGGKTKFKSETIYSKQKCAVVRDNKSINNQTESTNNIQYIEILFTSPSLELKQGDKIIVTLKNGNIVEYRAGVPDWFSSHQEVILEREDRA